MARHVVDLLITKMCLDVAIAYMIGQRAFIVVSEVGTSSG